MSEKIYYETKLTKTGIPRCITPCPYKCSPAFDGLTLPANVASAACCDCPNFINRTEQYVECDGGRK